ncbi:DUF262 domain-containing HNH endonuclease family protein [Clostridium sp. NSJ-145]|uniref:DUF262 domain-containing protein n=1 Tax=Clostridium sp. NSJ-145 TaxID=2897777 RepID=UPI001E2A1711|nr:DUF262 domain-containing protein [Clostridium sp. NSJ-145]MCD2501107.1 DUF262 domain-containing HNH endonuclease family protein [Clostridium sp. NSJ-145]
MGKIKAQDDNTLRDLLQNKNFIFRIPINQRKYSWQEEQLEAFWEDFVKLVGKNSSHYLGVVSLITKEIDDMNFKCFEIIDGQQRITTVILLVSALRDVYLALKDINKAKGIHANYLSAISTRKCLNKLEVSRLDKFTFSKIVNINEGEGTEVDILECAELELKKDKCRYINNDNDEFINNTMIEAYKFFYNKLIDYINIVSDIKEQKNRLLDIEESLGKIDIIIIKSDDIESMFLFFDSLNNRGLQLSRMDIIRNSLLKIIQEKFPNSLDEFGELWDRLVIRLDSFDELKFLKYYFMCTKENKIISEKELPKRYEQYFNEFESKGELKKEIQKIIDYSKIYTQLFDKSKLSTNDTLLQRVVKQINQLGQQACYSFFMEYIYNVDDNNRQVNIAKNLENMMYRRIICGKSTKPLDGIFREFINLRLPTNNLYEFNDIDILNRIKENSPNDEEFKSVLIDRVWERNEITNYTLRKYEFELLPNHNSMDYILKDRQDVHIEHIMPENFNSAWQNQLGISDKKGTYDVFVKKLGNLVLLDADINTAVKDSLFNVKKELYKDSTLLQTKELLDNYTTWNIEDIRSRTDKLANKFLEIWNLD